MYAIIKTGGKQYKVAADDVILVEKIAGKEGDAISFDQVLMMGDGAGVTIGAPTIAGASVTARVIEHRKADKVIVFKKNRRHNYRRKRGHRQPLTALRIEAISAA